MIDNDDLNVGHESVTRFFEQRRSTRAYTDVKPDRGDIREIIRAVRFAPNSCNLQHYGFIYIDDDAILKRLAGAATGKAAWAPALIVAIDDRRFSRQRRAGLQSQAAAVQNILLMATAKGLAAVWMAGFRNDRAIRKILGIPSHFEVTGLIGIGYADPDVRHEPTVRLGVDDYLHLNGFEQKDAELLTSTNVDDWPMEKLISYRSRIGSVYAPRKRINLYHREMTAEAAATLAGLIAARGGGRQRLLDIATYDGCFLRALHESGARASLAASDYSDYFLRLAAEQLPGTDTVELSPDHVPAQAAGPRFDVLSLAFKIEFLPRADVLLGNLRQLVAADGRLFVASLTAGTPRALSYRVGALLRRANVYERNPLYHFGPYRHRTTLWMNRVFAKAGWRVEQKGKAGKWPRTNFSWWWLVPERDPASGGSRRR